MDRESNGVLPVFKFKKNINSYIYYTCFPYKEHSC